MSGRGRGRGRGAPPSGAKLLLMRSAQESGLGENNLNSLIDITKPALFPDFNWEVEATDAASRTRQSSTVYLINKGREMDHRIQTSAHWVRKSQTQVDVVRYKSDKRSHRSAQTPSDVAVLDQMGKNLATDEDYIPAELVPSKRAGARKRSLSGDMKSTGGSTPKKGTLEELEKKERLRRIEESRQANVLDEDAGQFSDAPPDEEEDEVEDYTTNYYESEDESDGGGDAEATF